MKRRVLAPALAAVVVIGGLLVYAARTHYRTRADGLPDLLQMIPADSSLVAYADVEELRQSPVVQRLVALAKPAAVDADYADFVRETGFDYQKDLDRVLLATRSVPESQTFIVADGRFDRDRIARYASRTGKSEDRGGRRVYVVPSAKSGKNISVTFLSAGRIALSDGGDLIAAIDKVTVRGAPETGADAASSRAALLDRISRVSGAPLFAVAKAPASDANSGAGGIPASPVPLAALRWVSVAARTEGERVLLSAEGECDNADAAKKLATSLEFMRAILHGGLANPNARSGITAGTAVTADKLLTGVQITSDMSRVRLLLPVEAEMLRALATPPVAKTPAPH